jgi:hypothetical protein
MARAKRLDAKGDRAGCSRALSVASACICFERDPGPPRPASSGCGISRLSATAVFTLDSTAQPGTPSHPLFAIRAPGSTNSADLIGTSGGMAVFNEQSSLHAFPHETDAFDGTKLLCVSLLMAIFSLVDPHLDLLDQTEILSHRSVARCLHRSLELLDVIG